MVSKTVTYNSIMNSMNENSKSMVLFFATFVASRSLDSAVCVRGWGGGKGAGARGRGARGRGGARAGAHCAWRPESGRWS